MDIKQPFHPKQLEVQGASERGGPRENGRNPLTILLLVLYGLSKIGELFKSVLKGHFEQSKLLDGYVNTFLSLKREQGHMYTAE